MNTINEAFKKELKRALRDEKLTVEDAAQRLGITRQAFHNYLNGTSMPRSKRLARVVRLFRLNLRIGTESFTEADFPEPAPKSAPPPQPTLWDALDKIESDNLRLAVRRVGKSLRLSVSIEIPA